ncbi:MAG: ATP-dependent endonuclease [Gammaproteobacteria bacterium]
MIIESVHIENFRAIADQTISFGRYNCFVGPNGAGKSTVLAALNVFFRQFKDSKTDLSKLSIDDFHHKNIDNPIRITVTFSELSEEAKSDLSDYVRQNKLIVSAVAKYDPSTERAEVKQYGNRLGIEEFRIYFESDKLGKSALELKEIYSDLKLKFPDLHDAKTKTSMAQSLQDYESSRPEDCSLLPSEDQFYGASKGTNRLAPHVQWVFVPAVKDITEESQESKTSGLGQLLGRTVRSKVDFSQKIADLKIALSLKYQAMLDAEQSVLDELSGSIELRLKEWAHPDVSAKILWTQDSDKSVKVEEPWAYIKIGERGFESELARFGHGIQRSFMLTLLQELASIDHTSGPTLILAIEEPELYQHPPQARYLAEVLHTLSENNAQIALCSHSPHFIPGDDFEAVRVVRDSGSPSRTSVTELCYKQLAKSLEDAGHKHLKEAGMLAKLFSSLNPTINEMFFCRVLVLVEGIEDVAYITSYLSLENMMPQFRKSGCHIVPVGGKSEILRPLAVAKQLSIPVFVIFDADTDVTNEEHVRMHKKDNLHILKILGYASESDWPTEQIEKTDLFVWKHNITKMVHDELGGEWKSHVDKAALIYGQAGGLSKNPLAIAKALELAWHENLKSPSLTKLARGIINFAESAIGIQN